ncbi:MAG: FAD dependent oxidoreductase [uncultured bacterium]|nr:MAG: FAD dependent oxidoreductase [uncultured bacterium]
MKDIFLKQLSLFLRSDFNFRKLAIAELKKYNKRILLKQADALIESLPFQDFKTWGKPGIRAQLFDTQNKKLEMDFVVEGDEHSFHILNAVSPAFTCALPFADYISQHLACNGA